MTKFSVLSKSYTLLWRVARPFLQRHKRLKEGFKQRLVPEGWAEPATIWMQSSSGGEAYLVRMLLQQLPIQSSELKILLTTWTPQGRTILEETKEALEASRQDISIQIQFFPLDEPYLMEKALAQVNPKLVVLIETELWPGLLLACSKRNVPVLILNGRVREKSLKGYDWISRFFPEFWRAVAPSYITAISPADAARFAALFGEYCVGLVPNIKFDRAVCNLEYINGVPKENELSTILPNKPIILFASVREEEEALLIPVLKNIYSRQQNTCCIIIAPRHEHRIPSWIKKLHHIGIPTQLRSTLQPYKVEETESNYNKPPILIWDTFGELDNLYRASQAIFVGGSLAPLGGQNFLEPLSVGKIPCVGKHLDNFSWVFEPLFEDDEKEIDFSFFVKICQNVEELEYELEYQLKNSPGVNEVITRFNNWLEPRKGGVDRCVSLITAMLE